jgi:Cupin domain
MLAPGQAGGRYRREAGQASFLVLSGECLLLIEGQERTLRAWDFMHRPPDTEHGFVGAGTGPVRDLRGRLAPDLAEHGDRLPALRTRAAPRRRRRGRDRLARRGPRLAAAVATRAARRLNRHAVGVAAGDRASGGDRAAMRSVRPIS